MGVWWLAPGKNCGITVSETWENAPLQDKSFEFSSFIDLKSGSLLRYWMRNIY